MTRAVTKRGLIKKLDKVFSLYIRHKYAKDGMVKCYTCDAVKPIAQMQCGHFISRAYYSTRWEEDNCRPQDVSCNIYHQGMQYEFGRRLEKEIGIGRIEQMMEIKSHPARFSIADYQEMIDLYTTKTEGSL
jgi:hypothetical protein